MWSAQSETPISVIAPAANVWLLSQH